MYLNNKLAKNQLKINNVNIDLSAVNTPCYFLSTEQDHIAPWKSTFMSAKCFGGPVTFVLAGSGHIAGIVNPPSSRKYSFNYNPHEQHLAKDETDSQWLKNTVKEEGSWWKHWMGWLQKYSGSNVAARVPGGGKFKPLEDAPGTYVRKTL
jgi:polyhydroxyalkanoate synthase